MSIGVIISAYQDVQSLNKALTAYSVQTLIPDEIIIAEDGQSQEISQLVKKWSPLLGTRLLHIVQKDDGFRKNRILNKAIKASTSSQLIFTDQDILPRKDFVAMHVHLSKPGYFIAGGSHLNLKSNFHRKLLNKADIINQNIFNVAFIRRNTRIEFSALRLTTNHFLAKILDFISSRNRFIGCNVSAYREDILRVRGFDESLNNYGEEDNNIGIRLNNSGIKGVRKKYSLVCLHLDHTRGYANIELINKAKKFNSLVRRKKLTKPQKSLLL